MTNTNHASPRQDQPPIEDLEAEQDAVFDAMLDAYVDPPADVRDRLAGVAARTRAVLGGRQLEFRASLAEEPPACARAIASRRARGQSGA